MLKMKKFLSAKKGAELVEIILGVVIAIGLLAVAITYIVNTINKHTGENVNINDTQPKQSNTASVEQAPELSSEYVVVFENI